MYHTGWEFFDFTAFLFSVLYNGLCGTLGYAVIANDMPVVSLIYEGCGWFPAAESYVQVLLSYPY